MKLFFDADGKPIRQDKVRNLTIGDYSVGKRKKSVVYAEEQKEPQKTTASLEFLKEDEKDEKDVNGNNPLNHNKNDNVTTEQDSRTAKPIETEMDSVVSPDTVMPAP